MGLNFVALALSGSEGGAAVDPSVPLEDAAVDIDAGIVGYIRSLSLWNKAAKVDAVLPYACLEGTATFAGQPMTRDVCGLADPKFRLSIDFLGAPALNAQEFAAYRQDLVVGASVQVVAPVGQYDSDRLINIGTNRWSIKPEIGFSKALQHLTVEMAAGVTFYTDNGEFISGNKEQEPIYSLQTHVVHTLRGGAWLAGDVVYYRGGRSTIDGVAGDDLQKNSRFGLTFGLPLNRYQSLKLHASTGVATRTGTDFTSFALTWQYRWAAAL